MGAGVAHVGTGRSLPDGSVDVKVSVASCLRRLGSPSLQAARSIDVAPAGCPRSRAGRDATRRIGDDDLGMLAYASRELPLRQALPVRVLLLLSQVANVAGSVSQAIGDLRYGSRGRRD